MSSSRKEKLGTEHPHVAETLSTLGRVLLAERRWVEAEPLLRESLAIWDTRSPDDWNRFNTQSLLGKSLIGQKKYAKAEPLLLAGYEGMKNREARTPRIKEDLLEGSWRANRAILRNVG